MSQSLRTKLILSYLAIAILTALFFYVLVRLTSGARLKTLILEQQIAEIRDQVAVWYEAEGNWEAFDAYFRSLHPPPPKNGNFQEKRPPGRHGVIDAEARVLIGFLTFERGEVIPAAYLLHRVPVQVGGEIVAYVVPDEQTGISFASEETIYLRRTNQVLIVAGLGGIAAALLMGLALSRVFIRPILDLTHASEAMATGNLEQRVPIRSQDELGQLAVTFNQMSTDLAQAHQQRRQMTADIAHDLGTPLQVISGYIEAMQDGTLAVTPARMETIAVEIDHLRRLVSDLDLLSQTDTRTLSLRMEWVDSAEFITHIIDSFTPLAQTESIKLDADLAPDLPPLYADEERLLQVLGNLITNALRYTPRDGKITISAKSDSDALKLQVKDSGTGIAAEDLPHIFDRFYRADTARTDRGKMGLGLAISKALVEAMGGEISAESTPHGTTFTLRFKTEITR